MKRISWIAMYGIFVVALAACSPAFSDPPKSVNVTRQDTGKTIELRPGDQILITLEGNPTTGYTWETQPPVDEKILKQAGEPQFTQNSNLVGAGGAVTLAFQAIDPGQTDVTLVYHRPWETNVPPLETFKVTVKVAP